MRKAVTLENIFISVDILDSELKNFDYLEDLETAFRQKRLQSLSKKDGLEIANEQQFLMVLGGPGVGKSTFLNRIELEVLKGSEGEYKHECLPIMLRLRGFTGARDGLESAIETNISLELEYCHFPNAEILAKKLLKSGKLLCLLDGLDEVSSSHSDAVVDQINNFVYRFNSNRYIISCRTAAYRSRLPNFVDATVTDFDDIQIQNFIVNWFHAEIDKKSEKANQLWSLLQESQNASMKEIARTPLLLVLLCIAFDRIQGFPTNYTQLYGKALDILIEEWAAEKRVLRDPIYEQWSVDLEKALLSKIAYDNFVNDRCLFAKKELINSINDFLESESINADSKTLNTEALLNMIVIQQGIIMERAKGIFSFFHLTFQEYLTAYYVSQEPTLLNHLVEHHLNNHRWQEVFLNLAEMHLKSDELLLLMEARSQQYISFGKLQSLIDWSKQITMGDTEQLKPAARRAVAIFIVLDLSLAFILDSTNVYEPNSDNARPSSFQLASDLGLRINFSHEYTPDFVHDLTYENALERALQLAYEFQHIPVFNQGIRFSSLINDLETIKTQLTDSENQDYRTVQSISNQALRTWFKYISFDQDLINLSVQEETALADYFYSMSLIIRSKKVMIRVSPKSWDEIERRIISLTGNMT